ncbi:hypothetical protein ASC77_23825 [Nocardioides sp. Root1257]|uniref:enoyl-CoA hydratase/isomerase family protein n=1 Tax=unclassified Nocardioides TaxID=2615069 RepID=UPI0006FED36A|nr:MULTISPECIES: enoyl-CoA hydratase/isomerase family protein [unclassified Nocardioides]KQW42688.1 hypothetical protein ASC77_23825 [Nocardioides sp. Root1257]KRC39946.1 hypothetical protein ASE24_23620 [Nocardioides sp. Root224]
MPSYDDYQLIAVQAEGRIVTASVSNGPMNLITGELLGELDRLTVEVEADSDALVLVLKSATPGFFICHARFDNLGALRTESTPVSVEDVPMNPVQRLCERLRSMDKVTIAQVEGRTTGGGAAIAMACDLRYAAIGGAVFNSFGVSIGTGLGGGGSVFLPRLVGRSRAMEVILAGLDLDAVTADVWGYVTRSLPAGEIDGYVHTIANRIAMSVPDVIRRTKGLVAGSENLTIEDGLRAENFSMQLTAGTPAAVEALAAFLELGGETIEGEQRMEELLGDVLVKTGSASSAAREEE